MGALGNPKTWAPYINTKDCTQGFCSLACPKWCYIIFPPPPPLQFPDDKSQTSPSFSPLVIAIIGILASAFLLVSYYAIISKYCGNSDSSRRRATQPPNEEIVEDGNNHNYEHEPWFISTNGLDEALIKNITIFKYKKGDGLIGSTDCSVCLGEFLEDDSLRLLPKCSHAFHVACIDTWLKSHSNCPLCRANIVSTSAQPVHPPLPLVVVDSTTSNGNHLHDSRNQVSDEETSSSGNFRKNPFRTFSDLGGLGLRGSAHVIDVRGHQEEGNMLRRSISMDHSHETQVSISDILRCDHGEVCQVENCQLHKQFVKTAAGESSKSDLGNASCSNTRSGVLHSVMSSVSMKRSFSSGRFLFSKHGRGSNAIMPV